MNDLILEREN